MSDQTEFATEAEVLADLARRGATPHTVDPEKTHVVVLGDRVEVLDLSKHREHPRRKVGTYNPATVDALIAYVNEHATDGTTIWVDKNGCKVTAVINDHSDSTPGWRGHTAVLQLLASPEWTHWLKQDGQYMDQESFAEHLQDGIEEIREPNAATMLEVAQTIQGATKADWKTATRLDNGEVSFAYHEEIEATAGRKAHLEIPQFFTLGVAPFYGEQPFELTARLRYRIREGNLRIGYKLVRPHDVVLAVLAAITDRLKGEGGFEHVYLGAPPA